MDQRINNILIAVVMFFFIVGCDKAPNAIELVYNNKDSVLYYTKDIDTFYERDDTLIYFFPINQTNCNLSFKKNSNGHGSKQ